MASWVFSSRMMILRTLRVALWVKMQPMFANQIPCLEQPSRRVTFWQQLKSPQEQQWEQPTPAHMGRQPPAHCTPAAGSRGGVQQQIQPHPPNTLQGPAQYTNQVSSPPGNSIILHRLYQSHRSCNPSRRRFRRRLHSLQIK